jgi:methionyl-tRNA formyltransferase
LRSGETTGAAIIHRTEAAFGTSPVLVAVPVHLGPDDTHGLH